MSTSARSRSARPLTVIRSGSPGPAPTNQTGFPSSLPGIHHAHVIALCRKVGIPVDLHVLEEHPLDQDEIPVALGPETVGPLLRAANLQDDPRIRYRAVRDGEPLVDRYTGCGGKRGDGTYAGFGTVFDAGMRLGYNPTEPRE